MKTFTINTLGCKVNQYESQQVRELLEQRGLSQAQNHDIADLVVVNTCCVTHTASAKSRQCIRKAQKWSPNSVIVVAGCLPVGHTDELGNIGGNICIIDKKNILASTINQLIGPETDIMPQLPALTSFKGHCRAFLKIQDGCDGSCTYCIIPKIRTKVCNKNVKFVLAEAVNLVAAGHKEIVLTGVFLGAYGHKTVRRKRWVPEHKDALADLLDKVAQVPGLSRVRLSSLEVGDVTDRLIETICKHDNIMPHLHLPLQSGSERIVKRMGRQYKVADFCKTIETLNLRLDRPAITTDIIVGFPGEKDEDFERTMEAARECEFAKIHVFRFSERKGTAAEKMQPKVEAGVMKERAGRLGALDKELQERFRRRFISEKVGVIVEDIEPMKGRCERYFMVKLEQNGCQKKYEKGHLVFGILQKNSVTADIIAS